LLLRVLRCFTSPRSPPHPMNSGTGDTTQLVPGYPIRTPWDHSSVGSSPRPIAASHVLHRPLVPRHPHVRPYTLDHTTRCSHPLYNSQPTTPPTTTNHPTRRSQQPGDRAHHTPTTTTITAAAGRSLLPHNPTGHRPAPTTLADTTTAPAPGSLERR